MAYIRQNDFQQNIPLSSRSKPTCTLALELRARPPMFGMAALLFVELTEKWFHAGMLPSSEIGSFAVTAH